MLKNIYLGLATEISNFVDFSESIQSSRVFYTDSGDTKIVGLPPLGGGVDTIRPLTGSLYLAPVFRKSVTFFLKIITLA